MGFSDVHLIKNKENVGFAGGNNQALRLARSKFVLLLNPDAIIRPGGLDVLIDCMLAHADAWAVGPAMLNGDGTPQRTGVRFPNTWNLLVESLFLDRVFPQSRLFGSHKELYEDPTRVRPVDYLQGACLMVRHEAIERVGLLDEDFFMYFEETDWCYRMSRAGGRVYYCPTAVVVHHGGGDVGHYDERRLVYFYESLLLFYRKHRTKGQSIGARCIVVLRSCVRLATWLIVLTIKPSLRSNALSSLKGYWRVLGLAFRRV